MEQIEHQETHPVAVTATPAAADLVVTMLQAHGLQAWHEAYAGVYPSIEWVEGHRVLVPAHEVEEALATLRALDRDDVHRLDP